MNLNVINKIDEISDKIDFKGNSYNITYQIALCVLKKKKAFKSEKGLKGNDIYQFGTKYFPKLKGIVQKSTFSTYLSSLSRRDEIIIAKDTGSHGYYLKEPPQIKEDTSESSTNDSQTDNNKDTDTKRKEVEKKLYPILEIWLQENGIM